MMLSDFTREPGYTIKMCCYQFSLPKHPYTAKIFNDLGSAVQNKNPALSSGAFSIINKSQLIPVMLTLKRTILRYA
jgi:hypothetical protein